MRDALVDAAQRLFAENGIDRVSLREIAAAAGQRNVNAVQYHFGDRAGLVRAIYERNIPALESLRAKQLAKMPLAQSGASPRDLLAGFFMPLLEHVDADGRRSYAAFQLQALKAPDWRNAFRELRDQAPVTSLMVQMILDLSPAQSPEATRRHLIFANIVFLSMIGDVEEMAQGPSDQITAVVDDTISLVTRMCLASPVD